ncbi:MAG: hypothetical protein LJF04_02340 [Gemmatimonadetes bacterium]|nr:hypothetical protein [Gemmatimonadota bacterium]
MTVITSPRVSTAATQGRDGTSVVETLWALVLGLFMMTLAMKVVAHQRAAVAALARESDALAAVRVARQVLGQEGRSGNPSRDGWAVSGDSLAIRAFRGIAYVCGLGPDPAEAWVEARGVRLPEPAKDSVLVLDTSGAWTSLALVDARRASGCTPDGEGQGQRWRLSGLVPPGAVLARYFERGSYHVADGALRYRRGGSGRQPLTPEVVRTGVSAFQDTPAGVTLNLSVEGSAATWRVFVTAGVGAFDE